MDYLTLLPKIYDPAVNPNPLASGYLTYGQLPASPVYISPLPLGATSDVFEVPSLLASATQSAAGVTLNTNGSGFNGLPGYNLAAYFLSNGTSKIPTGRTFSANANTGYAGFTNYTIDLAGVTPANINSISLKPVSSNFPVLDANRGFALEFDLAVLQESSAANRAGFSVLIISNDPAKGIELGFKELGVGTDRVFSQNATLSGAAETSSGALEITQSQTYRVTFTGNTYALSANGIQILSGSLKNYSFNPATSNPPFPGSANPYEAKNLIFFGDNTDQAYSRFTLGQVQVKLAQQELTPDLYDDYLASYGDLIDAFGYNPIAARDHYAAFGRNEGRVVDRFSEGEYIASYDDLINAFKFDARVSLVPVGSDPLIATLGYDPKVVTEHYIRHGYKEGRTVTFQADEYLASYGDLIQAFGYDLTKAVQHYLIFGSVEGRPRDLFDAAAYLNKYSDLQAAFGSDLDAATRHFVEFGYQEGRTFV